MRTSSKSIITASLVLPLLLVAACDRPERSPTTGAGSSQEKMAPPPSTPPATPLTDKSSPAPADLSKNPAAPPASAPAAPGTAPADQQSEPKKGY